MTPAAESVTPAGSAPEVSTYVYGAVPPEAVSVRERATPEEPAVSVAGLTVIGAHTTSVTLALAEHPENPLVALTVNVKEPAAVGVPERTPAPESARPVGRAEDENV